MPGDKSISHRVALIASLAEGTSQLSNFATSQDCASTVSCLRALGVHIERHGQSFNVSGRVSLATPELALDCGNSGSTMRILAGVLATQHFSSQLIGDSSLTKRPMGRIIEPLELMGARIDSENGRPPLQIHGGDAQPISYRLKVASAQVKSAILFAGLRAPGTTEVIETSASRNHTELLFNGFGVPVITTTDKAGVISVKLDGPSRFEARDIRIPGDASSAAYFAAAAMLLPESSVTIEDLGLNPTRAKYLSLFRSWGANIEIENEHFEVNEPVGTVRISSGVSARIADTDRVISGAMIPSLIDELPLLAVVGSQLPGGLTIADANELRFKESDRLRTTVDNLRQMGGEVQEKDDGLIVNGPTKLRGAHLDSFGDHRIAMAFSVAALLAEGESFIEGAECVAISFPEFFDLLNAIMLH